MSFFPNLTTFINIGPISIKWYAILILAGAFSAYFLSAQNIKKMGYPVSVVDDLFFGALIAGIVGARLWYILFYDLSTYLANPISIFMTWQGGMAIQGGLMLGAAYAFFFLKRKNISFMRFADAIVPNILIAQAIGRWGNFLNQEAYGGVVSESFYNNWPSFFKDIMLIGGEYRLPTFLLESALNVIGFLLIVYGLKKFAENRRGDLFYAYLMWYGITRFWVEGLRIDSLMFMGFRTAQLLSLLYLFIGVLGKVGFFRKLFKPVKPVVLFDLDGTLLDTEPLIIESMTHVLKSYLPQIQLTREEQLAWLGPTLTENLSHYLPEDKIEEAFDLYRKHNREIHPKLLKPIQDAEVLLKTLKTKGYTLGIVSSKKKDMVEFGLELAGFKAFFDVIIGYDEVDHHKPDPEGLLKACKELNLPSDDVVYVGDAHTDVQAAHRADMYSIAYLSHPERQAALLAEKPNVSITSLLEIEAILEKDHAWTHSMI